MQHIFKTSIIQWKTAFLILIIFATFATQNCNITHESQSSRKTQENMITIKTFIFNHFSQNTYLIYDETKDAILIDPGCFFEQEKKDLQSFIEENKLHLKKVVYTHCHLDHAFGSKFIGDTYPNIEFVAHKDEAFFIDDAKNQSKRFGIQMEQPPNLTSHIDEGEVLSFGQTELKTLHIPGHSPGSICFYNEVEKIVLVGDVLFAGSIGRSDLPGGDHDTLVSGIKAKLMQLPDDMTVYSGHGPTTTIGIEKTSNPFLKH